MKRVKVKNHKDKELIVQASMIPDGYQYVEDYKEPAKKKSKDK